LQISDLDSGGRKKQKPSSEISVRISETDAQEVGEDALEDCNDEDMDVDADGALSELIDLITDVSDPRINVSKPVFFSPFRFLPTNILPRLAKCVVHNLFKEIAGLLNFVDFQIYKALQHSDAPSRDGQCILEGVESIRIALQQPSLVTSILVKPASLAKLQADILASKSKPRVLVARQPVISAICGGQCMYLFYQ
jgi:hypothetical protein